MDKQFVESPKPALQPTRRKLIRIRTRGSASTDADRPDGQEFGIVKRYKKKESASQLPLAMLWIKSFGEDFIEYTSTTAQLRGMMVCIGVFVFGLGTVIFGSGVDAVRDDEWAWILIGGLSFFGMAFLCFLMALWCFRMELFVPEDQPTLFDRRHRKVYCTAWDAPPGFIGLFQRWSMTVLEYDWDLIDAEHQSSLGSTGPSVTRTDRLVFLVRKSADDPTIVDRFSIGHGAVLTEATVPCIWEHIRRFMEEDGPHLPPGETLAPPSAPKNFWHSFQGPFGPNYFEWWKNTPFIMLVFHLIFPFTVPTYFFWGLGNWFSYKTSTPVTWPKEVMNHINALAAEKPASEQRKRGKKRSHNTENDAL